MGSAAFLLGDGPVEIARLIDRRQATGRPLWPWAISAWRRLQRLRAGKRPRTSGCWCSAIKAVLAGGEPGRHGPVRPGERTGQRFRPGDRVRVRSVRADLESNQSDFVPIDDKPSRKTARPRR